MWIYEYFSYKSEDLKEMEKKSPFKKEGKLFI